MPPKDSKAADKNVKVEMKTPATPDKPKVAPNIETSENATPKKATPVKATPKKGTPRKKDEVSTIAWKSLPTEAAPGDVPLPLDINCSDESYHAVQGKKGSYSKILQFKAANSFVVAKTFMIDEGEYKGYQAIVVKPAKAFKFRELPEEVRNRVYRFYFACQGIVNAPIVFDGKRSSNKDAYPKSYADGSENRVALLATNKEIYKEAVSIFYAQTLRFDNTQVLLDFLSQACEARGRLRSVEVKTYSKTTARTAMQFLAEAKHLHRLHFDTGVSSEPDPKKAARTFYDSAFRLLKAVGEHKLHDAAAADDSTQAARSLAAGVDMLSFAKTAFTYKDDKKNTKDWDDAMLAEFDRELRRKMQAA